MTNTAFACGACGYTLRSQTSDQKWYFEYLFDQVNWDKMDAREAHNLHHSGHEFHDKTTEDFHHFKLGRRVTDRLEFFADIPYVIRRSLEVENHAILGSKQRSEGWGDTQIVGDYRFWQDNGRSLSAVAGMQFPTGSTRELNSVGTRFGPELQPGLGAYNYIVGAVYRMEGRRSSLTANATYVFTTRGAQEFETGDIVTLSTAWDYAINPRSKYLKFRAGVDAVFQYEQQDKVDGVAGKDSGGQVLLAGPVFKVQANEHLAFTGSLLLPVYQHLGGVHQQLDYEWMMGGQLRW